MIARSRSVLHASWVGDSALSILASNPSGRVQGVYHGAVNIMLSGGLVSLVPATSDRGPINVGLSLPWPAGLADLGAEVGQPVTVEGMSICLGGHLAVSLHGATGYLSRPVLSSIVTRRDLRRNLEAARKAGLEQGHLSGLGQLLAFECGRMTEPHSSALNLFSKAASPRIDRLVEALRRANTQGVGREVSELIGLGPGLTPASDDFLAGMAIFIALCSEHCGVLLEAIRALATAIASKSKGRTTALSEAFLQQAAAGRGNETVMAVCKAILSEGPEEVLSETRRLLALGGTSGTDTLLGIVVAGDLCAGEWRSGGVA